LENKYL